MIAEGHRDISYAEHVPIFRPCARGMRAAEDAMDAHMRSAAGRLRDARPRLERRGRDRSQRGREALPETGDWSDMRRANGTCGVSGAVSRYGKDEPLPPRTTCGRDR